MIKSSLRHSSKNRFVLKGQIFITAGERSVACGCLKGRTKMPCLLAVMKNFIPYFLLIVTFFYAEKCNAQINCDVPDSPTLTHVTINPANEHVTLSWIPSPSTDIAAYIIYRYINDAGIPIDTIWNPAVASYTYSTPATKYFSITYVVAAHRNPNCTSPLSNVLNTIFSKAEIDTCNNRISVKWSKYLDEPISYAVMASINGGDFTQIAELPSDDTEFIFENFVTNIQYSFFIEAKLEGGGNSKSNLTSVLTNMKRPPKWINADYATVENNRIELSFTIDPDSEIKTFLLEKQTGNTGNFIELAKINSSGNTIRYTDDKASLSVVNHYRLSAINNCGNPIITSNEATNIVLATENTGDVIHLKWNPYKKWNGHIYNYSIFAVSGSNTIKIAEVSATDTSYVLDYNTIMYDVNSGNICFFVSASEMLNPYGINGASVSQRECITPVEVITVPNVFTPNNDLRNDLFKPVLSFIPSEYHLIITDRQGRILFETRSYDESWDGSYNGSPVRQDVYLWRLRVTTPSRSVINKTGTVTVYFNR